MKVIFAGGGTGGHVYPSLAVARALEGELRDRGNVMEPLYIGVRGRIDETIVPRDGLPFRAVAAGQMRVSSPLTFIRSAAKLVIGVIQSTWIIFRFKPAVVFATGGYASVPVGVAAKVLRRPLVVFLPDVTPGWAVRLLSRLATRMATTSERALSHLPAGKTSVVGYPVRGDFWRVGRADSRDRLGVPRDGRLLLVTAGSLGARRINEAIFASLPALLEGAYVMHITGAEDEANAQARRAALPSEQQQRYIVRGYADDMPSAMTAADLVVSRAGASVLGELPAAGVPAILVPGEYEGWSQAPNAEYLQSEGAAVMLRNADLAKLGETALALLRDDSRRGDMAEAMKRLARPDAARDLARVVLEVAA